MYVSIITTEKRYESGKEWEMWEELEGAKGGRHVNTVLRYQADMLYMYYTNNKTGYHLTTDPSLH